MEHRPVGGLPVGGWPAGTGLGGITGSFGSWRAALVVIGILGIVSSVLSLVLATSSAAPERRYFDTGGQGTLAVGLIPLLYAVIQGPTDGWAPSVIAAFAAGGSDTLIRQEALGV